MRTQTWAKWPWQIISVVLYHAAVARASTPLSTDEHGDYNGADLIAWIASHPEGDVHPSVRIGREVPGDPTTLLGLFAASGPGAAPIEKGDVLARVPWDRMIHPDAKYRKYNFFSCRAVYNLARELARGEDSDRAPYVRYLLAQPRGALPGEWTPAGQAFLASVLGHGDLPPYEDSWRTRLETEWIEGCSADADDDMGRIAYWLFTSRDEDSLMVPVYDMANHSNDPDKLNTLSFKPDRAGDSFQFVASRKIPPGEQIYNSYNRCNQCSEVPESQCETFSFQRTSDLLVSFGFVEDHPQNWMFHSDDGDDSSDDDGEFEFCLKRDPGTAALDAFWDEEDMPDDEDVRWLGRQHARLEGLAAKKDTWEWQLVREEGGLAEVDKMTRWEWDTIWKYQAAVSRAIHVAIQSANGDGNGDGVGDEL